MHLTTCSPSSKEAREGPQSRNLVVRTNTGAKEPVLLTGSILMAWLAYFLRAPRTTSPGVVLTTVSCA